MYRIDIDLKYVEKTIRDLERETDEYEVAMDTALMELMEKAEDKLDSEASKYGIDGSAMHETKYIDLFRNYCSIGYDSEYAEFVEFGTGILGAEDPHPEPDGWSYDVKGRGHKGWFFSASQENESNEGDFTMEVGRSVWTKGMPSRPVLYNTYQYMKLIITKTMRKHLRRVGQ